uniref:F-box domain-containing protein n=1 Tax=Meloidogyne floridensis TaxID=298350 RepID=A0A915NFX6_9BILA
MKSKNKKLPLELLVDIFKATDFTILKFTSTKVFNDDNIPLKLKQKEFEKLWTNCVINLLTSSSIVYIFVGKIFKKRLTKIPKLAKEIEERYAEALTTREMIAKTKTKCI